jgi:Sugar-transfer associated ATP-grasp
MPAFVSPGRIAPQARRGSLDYILPGAPPGGPGSLAQVAASGTNWVAVSQGGRVMAPDAFGTVRAVTYMHDQRSTLMAAVLRIVVEGNVADNFSSGATGNLLAPLDPLTGTLTAVRGSRLRTFPVIFDSETHPTTGIRLVGVQVPRWSDVLSLVLRAQACFAGDFERSVGTSASPKKAHCSWKAMRNKILTCCRSLSIVDSRPTSSGSCWRLRRTRCARDVRTPRPIHQERFG